MTKGIVKGIISNLVFVEVDGPVAQNEICYINLEGTKLMAEVIKIMGKTAYTQVFESTRGLKPGATVEFNKRMLEAKLGPGMLSKNLDGLQDDLNKMDGLYLKRGQYTDPLDESTLWKFTPLAEPGNEVSAGDWLGEVAENWIKHKIMVPFKMTGKYKVTWVAAAGEYKISEIIAKVEDQQGISHNITMVQYWPVKLAVRAYKDKPRPFKTMETGMRAIDTLNPIAEGGTGFTPGPFGAGKTVMQHLISQYAEADLIIVAACGERANEVVELFVDFPKLEDPRTGRKLMERTIIICNTSNMPVAAREASVYTAMTIAEYYRSMGLRVLLLADSTSRWAQALREMSNRMEELPGPDAYPMDLPAIISNFYSRAGYVHLNNGEAGSITFIGAVSPPGGNLKEPVTEATKKVARCFYCLSQDRADSKRYPAIDPFESYSKYLEYEEVKDYLNSHVHPNWVTDVMKAKNYLLRGKEASDQINILGDDSVPLEYHDRMWKSEVIDRVILMQNGYNKVDRATPMKRQAYMLEMVLDICNTDFDFESWEVVQPFYIKIINTMKQMNFIEFLTPEFKEREAQLKQMLDERKVK